MPIDQKRDGILRNVIEGILFFDWLMSNEQSRQNTSPPPEIPMNDVRNLFGAEFSPEHQAVLQQTKIDKRLMTQQNWPFENRIAGVTSGAEMNEASNDDPSEYFDDQDVAEDAMVYIVEGGQICYGSKRAWETARGC
ncbi:hypothetical protein Poly41_31160 [Novipirellula artificiosorum]|uniref:Uncharacterized protein n=2 Tax=Novipirellula artificiosorum TaxID=2528016 RepID=A0A5C6DV32_9BACT|nr:hypothetical protein Poly41_31160 [Novipirellula artificiosorum]